MDQSAVEVNALAINVAIPEHLQWTDVRRGEAFTLTTLTVRLLPDGQLAVKPYGRPTVGGRGAYVSFGVAPRARGSRRPRRGCGRPRRCDVGRSPWSRLAIL